MYYIKYLYSMQTNSKVMEKIFKRTEILAGIKMSVSMRIGH